MKEIKFVPKIRFLDNKDTIILIMDVLFSALITGILIGFLFPQFLSLKNEKTEIRRQKITSKLSVVRDFSHSASTSLSIIHKILNLKIQYCEGHISKTNYDNRVNRYWSILVQQNSIYRDKNLLLVYFSSDDFKEKLDTYIDRVNRMTALFSTSCNGPSTVESYANSASLSYEELVLTMTKEIQRKESDRLKQLNHHEFLLVFWISVFLAVIVILLFYSISFVKRNK